MDGLGSILSLPFEEAAFSRFPCLDAMSVACLSLPCYN